MTFAIGHVEGGTRAGWKRPLREKPNTWPCYCEDELRKNEVLLYRFQPGYLASCPDCGARRDG